MRSLLLGKPRSSEASVACQSRDDDRRLVAAARIDPRAFAPLYSRYFDPIYRYCIRRLGHPEEAADVTAQVFVKALAALPRYREDTPSFRSWLFAIAHNVLVDEYRSRHITLAIEEAADVTVDSPSLEDEILTAEIGGTIRRLLAQLTEDQRQVMELRLAGLTAQQIADTVGRSLGSIKIAQVRAMKQLRITFGLHESLREEAPDAER